MPDAKHGVDATSGKDDSARIVRSVRIRRADNDRQIVWGEVYAPNRLDTYGEFMLAEDIETMAHRFMQMDLRYAIDTNHDETPNGAYPVESFIARKGDPDYAEGAWVLGVHVPDTEVWAQVKRGELNGFSFQAMVTPASMDVELAVLRDHVGATEPGEDGHTHVYFLQVNDQGRVTAGWTDEVNGHRHSITRATATETAADHTHRFFL